jgi:hypothetical protein
MSLEAGDLDMAFRIGTHAHQLDKAQPHGRLVCAMVEFRRGLFERADHQLGMLRQDFPDHPVIRALGNRHSLLASPTAWLVTGVTAGAFASGIRLAANGLRSH